MSRARPDRVRDAGPGFHHWPPGHIPQTPDTNALIRIRPVRSGLKKTFGETFGEARAATVVSGFAAKTGRLRGQRPQLQKYPHPKPPTSGDAATVADRRSPRTRALSLITGPQMREQNHIANRFRTGQHHDQSIDPEAQPARTRHSMLKSQQKFFI